MMYYLALLMIYTNCKSVCPISRDSNLVFSITGAVSAECTECALEAIAPLIECGALQLSDGE